MPGKMQLQPHTDINVVLDQLERVVRWSEEFQLVFVKCNHPVQQEVLRRALLARLHDKRVLEVVLEQPIVSLLDEITDRWDPAAPPQAVLRRSCSGSLISPSIALPEAHPTSGPGGRECTNFRLIRSCGRLRVL